MLYGPGKFIDFIATIRKTISYCDRRQLVNAHHKLMGSTIFACCAQHTTIRFPEICWTVEASCDDCCELDWTEKKKYVTISLILDELLGRDIRRLVMYALITREFDVPRR
jgi:hypothetical protein